MHGGRATSAPVKSTLPFVKSMAEPFIHLSTTCHLSEWSVSAGHWTCAESHALNSLSSGSFAVSSGFLLVAQDLLLTWQSVLRLSDIFSSLWRTSKKLLADTRQIATMNKMGELVKFVLEFKDKQIMIFEPLTKMVSVC